MPVKQISIEEFLKRSHELPVFDVRSPSEFSHAHIPGAFSLPLFSDEERKLIGTAYKQEGREMAVNIGLNYFSGRMKIIPGEALNIFNDWEKITKNSELSTSSAEPGFLVHCWRGGMRSEAIAWLLSLYGYRVYVLKGGYKAFRNWALQQFEKKYSIKVLGGFTGSGKTEILNEMGRRGKSIIDLEKLASHRGSAFGYLGQNPQPKQEMFENLLAFELSKAGISLENSDANTNEYTQIKKTEIWVEDESRNIGNLNIPTPFWNQMRSSRLVFLEIPFDSRLDFICSTYGLFKKDELIISIRQIQKKLGGLQTKKAVNFLLENNARECFFILLEHYDKLYKKSLMKRENVESVLQIVECEAVDINNANKLC